MVFFKNIVRLLSTTKEIVRVSSTICKTAKLNGDDPYRVLKKINNDIRDNLNSIPTGEYIPSTMVSLLFFRLSKCPPSSKENRIYSLGDGTYHTQKSIQIVWDSIPKTPKYLLEKIDTKIAFGQAYATMPNEEQTPYPNRNEFNKSAGYYDQFKRCAYVFEYATNHIDNDKPCTPPCAENITTQMWRPCLSTFDTTLHELGHAFHHAVDLFATILKPHNKGITRCRSFMRAYREDIKNLGGWDKAEERCTVYAQRVNRKGPSETFAQAWAEVVTHDVEALFQVRKYFPATTEWMRTYLKEMADFCAPDEQYAMMFAGFYYHQNNRDSLLSVPSHQRIKRSMNLKASKYAESVPAHARIRRLNKNYSMPSRY